MTLEKIMKLIGDKGFHVDVRYDPERKENNFTVIIGHERLTDTDEPAQALKEALLSENLYWQIEFLVDTFGNYKGDIVYILHEGNNYIYYEDGFDRWCSINKDLEGLAWKKVILE